MTPRGVAKGGVLVARDKSQHDKHVERWANHSNGPRRRAVFWVSRLILIRVLNNPHKGGLDFVSQSYVLCVPHLRTRTLYPIPTLVTQHGPKPSDSVRVVTRTQTRQAAL